MSRHFDNFDSTLGSHQPYATPEPEPVASLDGLRILVIEDHALTRLAMECLLTSWGCRVTLADGALMACDKVRHAEAPDIILSDYQLNDGYDGLNAIRLVRELAGSQIPACLISADVDQTLVLQAQAAGVYFWQKSVQTAKLRSMLCRLHLPEDALWLIGQT